MICWCLQKLEVNVDNKKTFENTIRLMNDTCWYVASPSYSDSYTAARHRLTNQCTSTRLSLLVAVLNSSLFVPQNHLGLRMYEAANFTLTSKQPPSFFSDVSFWTWLNFTDKPKLKTTHYMSYVYVEQVYAIPEEGGSGMSAMLISHYIIMIHADTNIRTDIHYTISLYYRDL